MKRRGVWALIVAICVTGVANSGRSEETHDHVHHDHEVSGPELGVSTGYVRLAEEREDALGLHAHLLYRLGDDGLRKHFAIGIGAEYLFAEEQHYALLFSLAAHPWRGLILSVSPGVQWAEHEGDTESAYSTHLEVAYVVPLGGYHLGPVIDYSWTKDEAHYMIGLHLGIHL